MEKKFKNKTKMLLMKYWKMIRKNRISIRGRWQGKNLSRIQKLKGF